MSTDDGLVNELREQAFAVMPYPFPRLVNATLAGRAANEIERLRAENAVLRAEMARYQTDAGYDANGSPVGGCIHCGGDH